MRYVIWSYEHNAWWNPARMGYTTDLKNAGRYTDEDSSNIVREANIHCTPNTVNEVRIPLEDIESIDGTRL